MILRKLVFVAFESYNSMQIMTQKILA